MTHGSYLYRLVRSVLGWNFQDKKKEKKNSSSDCHCWLLQKTYAYMNNWLGVWGVKTFKFQRDKFEIGSNEGIMKETTRLRKEFYRDKVAQGNALLPIISWFLRLIERNSKSTPKFPPLQPSPPLLHLTNFSFFKRWKFVNRCWVEVK